jgi:hypothetical protein
MKVSYYPGCTMKNHAGNFEESLIYAMKHLGIDVEELNRWNCCGTVLSLAEDDAMRADFVISEETVMRFVIVVLVTLFTIQSSFACPPGYRPCGVNGALCCR